MTYTIPDPHEELARLTERASIRECETCGYSGPCTTCPTCVKPTTSHYDRELKHQADAVAEFEKGVRLIDSDKVRARIGSGSTKRGTVLAVVWDGWRNRHRVLVAGGVCVSCRRKTGEFTDGENDPRGALGDYAASEMDAADHVEAYEPGELVVPACFLCQNDEPRYRILERAMEAAMRKRPPIKKRLRRPA